ncbi:MAG: hypothetical protein WBQ21_00415 [Solirubrobacteraceae bacterium]
MLDSRRKAIFKPFAGQHPNACANYQQDPFEAVAHEVMAWRLAHALGGPWDQLIPAAVLRDIQGPGPGVLINWRRGSPDPVVFEQAGAQVSAAAFWDALIGQQDRHATNFRYDAEARRLALIDNSFAFARPSDLHNQSLFLAYRRSSHMTILKEHEITALEQILDSDDLLGLRLFLAEDRANAFEARARGMLERKMLPLPGDF